MRLRAEGRTVLTFDGDQVRKARGIETDFSRAGILKNNYEVIRQCESMRDLCDHAIVSLISPFSETREEARKVFGEEYIEVYMRCAVEALIGRDPKGLYRKAIAGEIDNLIGFREGPAYDIPKSPEIVVDSDQEAVEGAVERIIEMVYRRGVL